MLDIDHGTYPFVTSSSAAAGGACTGTGVAAHANRRHRRSLQGLHHPRRRRTVSRPRTLDEAGERIRKAGNEFGSVTGRPRRCGWFDVPLLRYTAMVNGFDSLIVTKLDVLDELEEIPVCTGYRLNGRELREMPATNHAFERIEPVYEQLPGWRRSTRGVSSYDDLPSAAKQYIEFLETRSGVEVGCVSTGPERTETMSPARHTAGIPAGPVVQSDVRAVWPGQNPESRRSGSMNENVDPTPGVDAAQILPPCDSTIFLQIARPMPVPRCPCRAGA